MFFTGELFGVLSEINKCLSSEFQVTIRFRGPKEEHAFLQINRPIQSSLLDTNPLNTVLNEGLTVFSPMLHKGMSYAWPS